MIQTTDYSRLLDMHMHTTVSDGTDSPAEILDKVREAGLEMFAVTDHDAIKGSRAIRDMITEGDPTFVTGVEFSCKDEEGKYHILGYGYDPEAPTIRQVVDLGHSYRMKKVMARLEFLDDRFGFRFPQEELDALFALDNPGKPHIGNLMVKYGYADDKGTAIKKYINQLHFSGEYVRPEEAIEGILGAGGIPVLAHPVSGDGDQIIMGEALEYRVRRLVDYGLKGLEVFYFGYSPKERNQMLQYADRYGLYVTAGSDYHGGNKSMIHLGDTGMDEVDELPEGMQKFIDQFH